MEKNDQVFIDNLAINRIYDDSVLIKKILYENKFLVINFIYFSSYVLSKSNPMYLNALMNSDYLLSDGIGMQILAKYKYKLSLPNNNGTDFLPKLITQLIANQKKIVFYGSKISVSNKLKTKYKKNKKLISIYHGYQDLDFSKIKPNSFLLVGLGTPKQEIWVNSNISFFKKYNIKVFCVGGFFEFLSGSEKRAPIFIRKLKLEFVYRFIQNPKKNSKKFFNNFSIFFYLLKKNKN